MSIVSIASGIVDILQSMPSDLEVNVGPPDYSQPFDVPFTVINPNNMFDIESAQFSCHIVDVKTDKWVWIKNVATFREGRITVEGNAKGTFKCYFPIELNSTIMEASIEIWSVYKRFPERSESAHKLGSYRWDRKANPPRWTSGHLIAHSEPFDSN